MREDIKLQILNLKLVVNNFRTSCHGKMLKSGGSVDKQEKRLLKRIDNATDRFLRDLQNIQDRL